MAEDTTRFHDRDPLRGAVAFVAGGVLIGLAVLNQFRAEMGALDRLIELGVSASDEPLGDFAEGLFASILWWGLIIVAVLAATFIVAYFTRNAHPSIVLAVAAFVALGFAGMSVAARMREVPAHILSSYRDIPGAFQVWLAAAGAVAVPGAMGTLSGALLGRRRREQVLREADYRATMRAGSARETSGESPAEGTTPAVYRGERRSLTCGACGARNAPMNERCVRCGAALIRAR